MKGIDIFCASQAATAIWLNMDEEGSSSSLSSSSTIHLGRAIDRYNPIIKDPRRLGKTTLPHIPSCPSQPPISPKASNKKATMLKTSAKTSHNEEPNSGRNKKNKKINQNKSFLNLKLKRSSTAASANDANYSNSRCSSNSSFGRKSWGGSSKAAAGEFVSPPGSSRYLLSDQAAFFNVISDFDPVLELLPAGESDSKPNKALQIDESWSSSSSSAFKPSSSPSRSPNQVVVLRVSLHCRGCERKMRKHISKMEGVSSFNIDFAAKKVTVVGNVTPLEVLASISKVKNAQLWTPPPVPPFSPTNSSELKENDQGITTISS